jgi:outer membrane lipoprotein carrier protein
MGNRALSFTRYSAGWKQPYLHLFTTAVLFTAFPTIPAASLAADDVPTLARKVDEHYNHLRTLQAEFTEIYRGAGVERTESGTLWLKRPRRMRWEYRTPREKLFVTDGAAAWFYSPAEHQARRTSFKKLDDLRSPLAFLLGKTKLESELQGLALAPDRSPKTPGNVVLRGVPRHLSQVAEVSLEVSPEGQIAGIRAEEADGATTEYWFREMRENLPVSEERFRFQPPAGTEVVSGEFGQ